MNVAGHYQSVPLHVSAVVPPVCWRTSLSCVSSVGCWALFQHGKLCPIFAPLSFSFFLLLCIYVCVSLSLFLFFWGGRGGGAFFVFLSFCFSFMSFFVFCFCVGNGVFCMVLFLFCDGAVWSDSQRHGIERKLLLTSYLWPCCEDSVLIILSPVGQALFFLAHIFVLCRRKFVLLQIVGDCFHLPLRGVTGGSS